jgi:SET domain-containing protein
MGTNLLAAHQRELATKFAHPSSRIPTEKLDTKRLLTNAKLEKATSKEIGKRTSFVPEVTSTTLPHLMTILRLSTWGAC